MGKQFGSTIDLAQFATPSAAPASGRALLYVKSDNKVYVKDSSGVETLVGPATSSGTSGNWKQSCRLSTGGNFTLSSLAAVDLTTPVDGDRILVLKQTNVYENGIYIAHSGAWTRAPDMATWADCVGAVVAVEQGNTRPDTVWLCLADQGGTLGTTNMPWTQIAGPQAVVTSVLADGAVTDVKVAAANKDGVTTLASMRTLGTGAQQACAGNDSRLSDARTPLTHTHAAADVNSGTLDVARLGSTPAATTYLKGAASGAGSWATAATVKTDLALTKTDVGLSNVTNVAQEPAITAGTTAQYWRGDKTWQTGYLGTDGDKGDVTVASSGASMVIDTGAVTQAKLNLAAPSNAADAATKSYVDARVPTGAIMMWATATAPSGWLLCDGTLYTNAAQPALAAVIGVTYGGTSGTNFNVPDMRGRFVWGAGFDVDDGTTQRALASKGGSMTISVNTMPAHTHDIDVTTASGSGGTVVRGQVSTNTIIANPVQARGGGAKFLSPYIAMNWIIKA